MKFKLDENLPLALAALLRARGLEAQTVSEEGLSGAADPRILAQATAEARGLMTFDVDFADVRAYPPGSHAGIVVFRLRDQRWATLEPHAADLLRQPELESVRGGLTSVRGGLTSVQEGRIRHRRAGEEPQI